MQHRFIIIGLNCQTAPAEIQRFWIPEAGRYQALIELGGADGIEEVVTLATYHRTEFVLWSGDLTAASNSVVRFLTQHYGLRSTEWQRFYRKTGKCALAHLFRAAAGLDCGRLGHPDIAASMLAAWGRAHRAGTSGRSLDIVFAHAGRVSQEIQNASQTAAEKVVEEEVDAVAVELGGLGAHDSILVLRSWVENLVRLEVERIRTDATLACDTDRAIDVLAMRLAERISQTMVKEGAQAGQNGRSPHLASLQRLLRSKAELSDLLQYASLTSPRH